MKLISHVLLSGFQSKRHIENFFYSYERGFAAKTLEHLSIRGIQNGKKKQLEL